MKKENCIKYALLPLARQPDVCQAIDITMRYLLIFMFKTEVYFRLKIKDVKRIDELVKKNNHFFL